MFCVDHGGLTRFPLLTIIAIFWLGVPTTICNIFSYLYYKYKMYFYSRAGDTHNDISTTQSTVAAAAIQINTFLGGILNCVWGLGWPRLCFSFVEHVFELKLVHDKCQDYCWGRDWQWAASDASRPSRINPNQTRIKLEKTNSLSINCCWGNWGRDCTHLLLLSLALFALNSPGLCPGPELGGWRDLKVCNPPKYA